MKLLTLHPGYFLNNQNEFVDMEKTRESPNRKGIVMKVERLNHPYYHSLLSVEVKFRDYTEHFTAFDMDEVDNDLIGRFREEHEH
jgi:hypothetical protein